MLEVAQLIERLLSGPENPGNIFIAPGYTYADVYAIAAGFRDAFVELEMAGKPVCVSTENKGIITAAMLAGLACDVTLVLPYSLSPNVIQEMKDALYVRYAVTDQNADAFDDIAVIRPKRGTWRPISYKNNENAGSIFLQLFTGGSTGKPKIWSKTKANLFSEAQFLVSKYGIGEQDRIVATVPPYHIYGLLFTVLIPLVARAVVFEGIYTFPQEIVSSLENLNATMLVSVPIHYRILQGSAIHASSLQLAFSSAGPLDRNDALSFYRQTGIGVEEIFGSTETGGIACKNSAVGRDLLEPFKCLQWKIIGERLCVRSQFISPDLPVDADGFYMTGDRAEQADGDHFMLQGRADGVIKVGGKRVDLNNVQDKMKYIQGIRDVFVFPIPGSKGRGMDIAAVVEADFCEAELREQFSGRLEGYEVPRRMRIIDKMPLTTTGKYDKELILKLFS